MSIFEQIYPPVETVLEMEPEELAPLLLEHLNQCGRGLNRTEKVPGTLNSPFTAQNLLRTNGGLHLRSMIWSNISSTNVMVRFKERIDPFPPAG